MAEFGRNPVAYGAAVVCIVVGLAVLLYSEYVGIGTTITVAGGAVALAGVAVLTAAVASLPEPADGAEH